MLRTLTAACAASLALAACAPATPVQTAVAVQPQAAALPATASLGGPTTNQATLQFTTPKAAYFLATTGVHHWEVNDMLQYEVVFKKITGTSPDTFDDANAVTVDVPVKGPDIKTQATFSNIPWGGTYRAFVTAQGNEGGVVGTPFATSTFTAMNATPASPTDFDFTTPQNANQVITHAVQVVYDATPFTGTANVTFATPSDGVYLAPSPAISGSAQ